MENQRTPARAQWRNQHGPNGSTAIKGHFSSRAAIGYSSPEQLFWELQGVTRHVGSLAPDTSEHSPP